MKSFWQGLVLILTLNCEQSAWLVSESFDRKLTWAERWAVRLHHRICRSSRELARQLRVLHAEAVRVGVSGTPMVKPSGVALSAPARERISAALRVECEGGESGETK